MIGYKKFFNTDLYSILNISEKTSADEIKRAFRSLAKKYHPDKNIGNKEAENKFKEIAGAYEILGNAIKKKEYDSYRVN